MKKILKSNDSLNFTFSNRYIGLFILIVFIGTTTQCTEREKKKYTNPLSGIQIDIITPTGDKVKDITFPAITNLGVHIRQNDTLEVMILGNRLKKGKEVVKPIGVLNLLDSGKEKSIILASTSIERNPSMQIEDLIDLNVNHGYVKRMIEQWWIGSKGLGQVKVINWEGSSKAKKMIQ